jgi:hypothetical protein
MAEFSAVGSAIKIDFLSDSPTPTVVGPVYELYASNMGPMLMAIDVSRSMLVMHEIVSPIGLLRATLSSASFRIVNPSEMHAGLPASLINLSASYTFAVPYPAELWRCWF